MKTPGKTLGTFIRDTREKLGLSLRELARRCRITAPFLSDIERDRRTASLEVLDRIAAELELGPDALREISPAAALKDFKKILENDPELSLAFASTVKSLKQGKISSKKLAQSLPS